MQAALKNLLEKIESTAVDVELTTREVMIRFPIPPSDFIKNLDHSEAWHQFSIVICAFNAAHYSMYLEKSPWLAPTASRDAQYKALYESLPLRSIDGLSSLEIAASSYLRENYGDSKLAFNLARNEVEGGIYQILQTMSDRMLKERTDSFIQLEITKHWGDLMNDSKDMPRFVTFEKRQKIVQSYKNEYAHFLPSEYLEEDIAMSTTLFDRTLARHHILMKRVKGLIH